jgi:hypothetical protein
MRHTSRDLAVRHDAKALDDVQLGESIERKTPNATTISAIGIGRATKLRNSYAVNEDAEVAAGVELRNDVRYSIRANIRTTKR